MAKSSLQIEAEKLAERVRQAKPPALVVEFAGVPKAGKTTTLNQVYSFLRRCGFKCEVVVERASVCPIRDKKHFNFNIWTACTTLAQLLEKTQNPPRDADPDILFIDRGIFDSLCWLALLKRLQRIRPEDERKTIDFLLIHDWTARISGVIAMSAKPADALEREQGQLPVEGPGGSIMNSTVLKQMRAVIKDKTAELKDQFRIFSVDTSSKKFSNNQQKTCEAVAWKILTWVKESIDEKILSAPRSAFPSLKSPFVVSSADAVALIDKFENEGEFGPRTKVESDLNRIQPLPVVVVRNKSGQVLRLIRRERDPSKALHKKITIWAGGHVRKADGPDRRGAIPAGAVRELQEELRLYVLPENLKLLGAVYAESDESTHKHVAFVYEWRAPSDDVEIALCNSEFIEKSGNSLQGAFVPVERVKEEEGELESWSVEILSQLLSRRDDPTNAAVC